MIVQGSKVAIAFGRNKILLVIILDFYYETGFKGIRI